MAGNKIAVCVPTPSTINTWFAFDLLEAYSFHLMKSGDAMVPLFYESALLSQSRETLAERALDLGATHILWLDSDMRLPKDLIVRLLEHDLMCVGANCSKRKEPVGPTAMDLDYTHIYPDPDKTGIQEVTMLGLAAVLMKTDLLKQLPKPWFLTPWIEEVGYYAGEDMYFCKKVLDNGFKLHVDHDVSWDIMHIGQKPYGMIDVMQEQAVSGN